MKIEKIIQTFVAVMFLMNVTTTEASLFKTGLTEDDSISVSLLTATKGKQIYEKFGHTGIRIHIPSKKIDGVYHYGLFSFEEPHFEYRFVKGETDYMIGLMHYHDFLTMYAIRGSSVRELPLLLTQEEAHKLYKALMINMLPENQTYRYSFLYDNCATRPLEIIKRSLTGVLMVDTANVDFPTYRNLIHECTTQDKWLTFALDLILDQEVDKQISLPDKPFLPHITEQIFATAKIEREGVVEQIATTPKEVLEARESKTETTILDVVTPNVFAIMVLMAVVVISFFEYRSRRHSRITDTILFTIFGTLGILVYFLLLFSEHPAVGTNINAMWMHPVWLVAIPFIWIRKFQKFLNCYHFINFALLLLYFVVVVFSSQEVGTAAILLVITLLIRSITYIKIEQKHR